MIFDALENYLGMMWGIRWVLIVTKHELWDFDLTTRVTQSLCTRSAPWLCKAMIDNRDSASMSIGNRAYLLKRHA